MCYLIWISMSPYIKTYTMHYVLVSGCTSRQIGSQHVETVFGNQHCFFAILMLVFPHHPES